MSSNNLMTPDWAFLGCKTRLLRIDRIRKYTQGALERLLDRFCLFTSLICLGLGSSSLQAAQLEALRETQFEQWKSVLYRNENNGLHFCALESESNGITLRLNQYKGSNDTFLELYNQDWMMLEGVARFSAKYVLDGQDMGIEMRGKSWGDSYTYDILDKISYSAILSMIGKSSSLSFLNSNGNTLAAFDPAGAANAVNDFKQCAEM